MGKVVGIIAVLFLIGLIVKGCGGDSSGSGGDGRDEIGASIVCEDFVKDRLKAPSTADFPSYSDYTITGSGDDYTVEGYVDAENGFGAMIRTDWTCTVRAVDEDGRFQLQSLTGLG